MQFAYMALFKDIDTFKKFVGGGANMSVELESIAPAMHAAAHNHLLEWIGEETWEALVDYVESANSDPLLDKLLPFVQRPLALLSLYEYSKIGGIQLSEMGILRVEAQDYKSAYKYQENAYRQWMLDNGYDAIEQMLKFLTKKSDDYTLWAASEVAEISTELFINYASEFRRAYAKYVSRYTFETFRPIIEDLELIAIRPCIGQELFDSLKEDIAAGNVSAIRKKLLKRIRKALANFTIKEALKLLWVRIAGGNVIQSEELGDQSYEKKSPAGSTPLSVKLQHQNEWGQTYLNLITEFLEDNIADFPEYQNYLDSQKTEDPSSSSIIIPTDQSIIRL